MSDEQPKDSDLKVVNLGIPAEHPMSGPEPFGLACQAFITFGREAMNLDDPALLTLSMAVVIGLAQKMGISPRMLILTFSATVEGVATGNVDSLVKLMDTATSVPGEKGKVH